MDRPRATPSRSTNRARRNAGKLADLHLGVTWNALQASSIPRYAMICPSTMISGPASGFQIRPEEIDKSSADAKSRPGGQMQAGRIDAAATTWIVRLRRAPDRRSASWQRRRQPVRSRRLRYEDVAIAFLNVAESLVKGDEEYCKKRVAFMAGGKGCCVVA